MAYGAAFRRLEHGWRRTLRQLVLCSNARIATTSTNRRRPRCSPKSKLVSMQPFGFDEARNGTSCSPESSLTTGPIILVGQPLKVIAKVSAAKNQMDDRYSRQVLFKGVGPEGQQRWRRRAWSSWDRATGSALASLLARSGVGTLRILDRDYVERATAAQALFSEEDRASVPKAIAQRGRCALQLADSSSHHVAIWFRLTSMPCSAAATSFLTVRTI